MELEGLPVIDWEQAVKLAGNKKDLAEDILNLFMQNLPTDIAAINQVYNAHNYAELLRRVHKLHGALCYCGLPRLKMVVGRLETDLKNNIMDSLLTLHQQLDIEVTLLLEQFSSPPNLST